LTAATAFLPDYMADFNGRFARRPRSDHDAHRPLSSQDDLGKVFCARVQRTMTANLVVHFERNSVPGGARA
jgi:hypothetical protein